MRLSWPTTLLRYIRTSSNMKIALSLGNGQISWLLRTTPPIKASSMNRRKFKNNKNRAKVGWYPTSDPGLEGQRSLQILCNHHRFYQVYHRAYNKIYKIILSGSWQSKRRLKPKKTSSLMPLTRNQLTLIKWAPKYIRTSMRSLQASSSSWMLRERPMKAFQCSKRNSIWRNSSFPWWTTAAIWSSPNQIFWMSTKATRFLHSSRMWTCNILILMLIIWIMPTKVSSRPA